MHEIRGLLPSFFPRLSPSAHNSLLPASALTRSCTVLSSFLSGMSEELEAAAPVDDHAAIPASRLSIS